MNIADLQRENIKNLQPYACARSEFKGNASVFLDANENPMNAPFNRYPDPLQVTLKEKIAALKGVRPTQIMLGNGSDEPIDLAIRIFCEPKEDNIISVDPTYGMYEVSADINNVAYRKVLLNDDFSLDAAKVLEKVDSHTKLIFLCSPNNPTANLLDKAQMRRIIEEFQGIVIVDEAYIDFAPEASWLKELDKYPNLLVLQTFSKAWGLASVRCGMAFASEEIVGFFNKVKPPYNLNFLTQNFVLKALDQAERTQEWVEMLLEQRRIMVEALQVLPCILHIFPTDANFILVKTTDATGIYQSLIQQGIIVRNRSSVSLCNGCLRITIGTAQENAMLIEAMKSL